MSTMHQIKEKSSILILQEILKRYTLNDLTQDEITFLQLHYLEAFSPIQIASLLDREYSNIENIAQKFTYY